MQRILLLFVLLTVTSAIGAPAGNREETEQLEQVFQDILDQLRDRNRDAFLDHWHPEAVLFRRNYLFPVDRAKSGADDWARTLDAFFERTVAADFRPANLEFRVIGDTGMVWGTGQFFIDAKEGGGSSQQQRLSAFFARLEGKWKIVHWHASAIPAGEEKIF